MEDSLASPSQEALMKVEMEECVEDREKRLLDKFRRAMAQLIAIWNKVGIFGETREERLDVVVKHLQNMLSDMVAEEEGLQQKILDNIEKYTQEVQQLLKDLQLNEDLPQISSVSTLLEKEKILKVELKHLKEKKEAQMQKLKTLRAQEAKLCKILHMPAHAIASKVPSDWELDELAQHIKMLLDEKDRREREFYILRDAISKLMEEIETGPNTTFEREILCSSLEDFVLSNEKLVAVKEVKRKLEKRQHDMEQQHKQLLERLQVLWSILNVEESERAGVLSEAGKPCPRAIKVLQDLVEKLEVEKRANLQKVIEKLKEDIGALADKCCLPSCQKEQLLNNSVYDAFTEQALEYYDAQLQKLHHFYNDNKGIFQSLEQRAHLWQQMLQFEKKATDRSRYNNRGGALLKEEKDRRHLLVKIPKLEEQLYVLVQEYKEKTGKDFSVYGKSMQEYIEDQWVQHRLEKENQKLERRQKQAMSQDVTLTPRKHKITMLGTPSGIFKCPRTDPTASYLTPRHPGSSATPRRSPRILRNGKRFAPPSAVKPAEKRILLSNQAENIVASYVQSEPAAVASKQKGPSPAPSIISCASYTDFTNELNRTARNNARSSTVRHVARKPSRCENRQQQYGGAAVVKNKGGSKLTPARGAAGLPFIF